MLFTSHNRIQNVPSNAILEGTSPNAIFWANYIHLFYTGVTQSPTGYGLWHTASTDGGVWTGPESIQTGLPTEGQAASVMFGTSPSAVLFAQDSQDSQLYLFYNAGGADGISYTNAPTAWSGGIGPWTTVRSVAGTRPEPNSTSRKVMDGTSPSAVFWNGRIYLFYTGVNDSGIWYTTSSDGATWSAVQSIPQLVQQQFVGSNPMAVMERTSPNAIVWNGQLCLFYTGVNGGIQYTATSDGQNWMQVQSIQTKIASMSVQQDGSASAIVFLNTLYVFYPGSTDNGLWYTTTLDGSAWSDAAPVDKTPSAQGGRSGTSPCVVNYENLLFVFWYESTSANQGLGFYRTIVEVDVGLVRLNGRIIWSWSASNSSALPFVGTLRLFALGTSDRFIFNLNPSVRGRLTTVEFTFNDGQGGYGNTQSAFALSGFQAALNLTLANASVGATISGSNNSLTLDISNPNGVQGGYYVNTILKVLVDNVEYMSPDPQIVLRPTTPITEPNPSSKSRQ